MMNVGFSKIKITPELGVLMGGHPGEKRAQSILTDLYAKSMAISDGMTTIVFACADVLFVGEESVEKIKGLVAQSITFPSLHLFVSATHTHSGPLTTGLFGRSSQESYVGLLEERLAESILAAISSMTSSSLYHTADFVTDMAFCARFIMNGGRIETHPFKDDEAIICPEGIPDKQFNTLIAYDEKNVIKGVLINFAQHPQIMERENTAISADFPSYLEKHIQSSLGRDVPVLFVNGPCGDVCPVDAQNKMNSEVGSEWCEKFGKRLGEAVLQSLPSKIEVSGKIEVRIQKINLPLRRINRKTIRQAKYFIKRNENRNFIEPKVSNYGIESSSADTVSLEKYLSLDCWKNQEYKDILHLTTQRKLSKKQNVEISVIELGRFAIVTLPFEAFAAIGLEIKSQSEFARTAIFELTNGNAGYLPTAEAFKRKGGYETLTLYSSRFSQKAGKIVIKKIVEQLNSIH